MNATTTNHPTQADRKTLRDLADRIGPAELLRLAAQIISNDHPDMHKGIEYRIELNKIATRYAEDMR